jgi:mono/diheme cytochrome c family protein
MSPTPSLKTVLTFSLLSLTAMSGCTDFESSFVYSDRTSALIPEAQDGLDGQPGVKSLLDEKFGTPQDLKAWLKLPVDFGGLSVGIEKVVPGDDGRSEVTFSELEDGSFPATAVSVEIMSGEASGEVLQFASWDADTRTAVLATESTKPLAAGDQCSIDRGQVLKDGRVLYMRHCSHCHGTAGDGKGPTAEYLNPRPRDYRHGIFKFTSTNAESKASRDDIARILKYGIPGTYMPSFLLLKDQELHAIVEYVRFLAMRGEYERKLTVELATDFSTKQVEQQQKDGESRESILSNLKGFLAADMKEQSVALGDELAEQWTASDTEDALIIPKVPRIADSVESRRRGRELYLSKTLNCADCHGVDGAGNGPQTTAFEKNPVTGELYPEAGLHDIWDNSNQPRNLQAGIYRGGRRPIDLFNRIHAGIKGSRMPSFKNTPEEDIWHVVNYILSVPFESEPGATGTPSTAPAAAATAATDSSDAAAK